MANPHRGEVALEVEGKVYTLVCNINVMCELEALLGKAMTEIISDMSRVTNLRAVLWACLKTHHQLTIEEAGDILQAAGYNAAIKINEALAAASPPDSRKGTGKNPR
jgi:hypothetical protein